MAQLSEEITERQEEYLRDNFIDIPWRPGTRREVIQAHFDDLERNCAVTEVGLTIGMVWDFLKEIEEGDRCVSCGGSEATVTDPPIENGECFGCKDGDR